MLILTSLSVWMVRNQSLMEMWWLFSSLARYPKEIFSGRWAEPLGHFFTYLVPILVVVNVPANAMVRVLDPRDGRASSWPRRASALAQPPLLPATRCGRIAARAVNAMACNEGSHMSTYSGYLAFSEDGAGGRRNVTTSDRTPSPGLNSAGRSPLKPPVQTTNDSRSSL